MRQCLKCLSQKEDSEYHNENSRRCKKCLAESCRIRYQERYKAPAAAARKARQDARKTHIRTVSDLDCAYAAGIIDGEGCIRINVRRLPSYKGVGQLTLLVHVTNTSLAMLDWLHTRWYGRRSWRAGSEIGNRKAQGQWTVAANKALHFLDDIYPYLVVKRPQAKWARRFQRYVQRGGRHRDQRLFDLQVRFAMELRRMNWRGFRPPTEQDFQVVRQPFTELRQE